MTADAPKADYQKRRDSAPNQYEMLKGLELSEDEHRLLADECKKVGIKFMSTPFSVSAARFLHSLGMKIWKIPSGELTNLPLLEFIAPLADKIILSTGMANMVDVRDALEVLNQNGAKEDNIFLLHCTTAYPTPLQDVNLRAMDLLSAFKVKGIGYSDHTDGIAVPALAVAHGATIIEKHFTLDPTLPGPDHQASITPPLFAEMVDNIRMCELVLGREEKEPTPSEIPNISIARKSIIASRSIKKGEIFSESNLSTKRPGTGISPMKWHDLIGKVALNDYETDDQILNNELL